MHLSYVCACVLATQSIKKIFCGNICSAAYVNRISFDKYYFFEKKK